MIDVLLQVGITKLLVSCVLTCLAMIVQRRVDHPALIHRFWLLVFVALLLPAVVAIPVLPGESAAVAVGADSPPFSPDPTAQGPANATTEDARAGLVTLWLLGTSLLLGWTLLRVLRFRHWLVRTSQPAPPELRDEVAGIGRKLGLTRMPAVHTTTARVSPMVCWTGGRVRVVVPEFLLAALDRGELRAMLAHELAHVRRRDHLVRWLEWLACTAFWWNPVAWWARREARASEEASCDALGAATLGCAPRDYAKSLLRVVELLSWPSTPPVPAFASGAANGRNPKALERRIRMLVSGKSNVQPPRWIRRRGTAAAICMLPLGMVYCGFADQPMPTAPEDAAGLVTLSEEPVGEQPTELVFTYDMTSNSDPDVRRLVYNGSPGCRWIVEPNGVCDDYWQKWDERLKKARAEPGGMRVLHIPSEATAGWVWRLQETILANP